MFRQKSRPMGLVVDVANVAEALEPKPSMCSKARLLVERARTELLPGRPGMIVDASILLYAVDAESPFNQKAASWLEGALNGPSRIGFRWPALSAFLRIATNARASRQPMSPREAWAHVEDWSGCESAWVPVPTPRHAEILGSLVVRHDLRANMVSDADLAALAIAHGLAVCSAGTDFARFPEVRWVNPLAEGLFEA